MAIVPVVFNYPAGLLLASTSAGAAIGNTTSYNTSGYGRALIFKVPKSGTLTRIPFVASTNTVNGTVNCSFQTVVGGVPSGTLYGGSTSQAVSLTGAGPYEAVLATPATATAGDIVAACVQCDATTVPTWQMGIISNASSAFTLTQFPYVAENTGAWAALNYTGVTCMGVGYGSTDYIFLTEAFPASAITTSSVSTTQAIRAWGAVFTTAIPMTISGVRYMGSATAIRTGTFQILDSAGTSTLATATVTLGFGTGFNGGVDLLFDAGATITLTAGVQYRVAYFPNTSSTTVMSDITLPNTGYMGAMSGGPNWWLTTQNSSGVWDDSQTTRYPFLLGLKGVGLSNGAGGGSTGYPASRVLTGM